MATTPYPDLISDKIIDTPLGQIHATASEKGIVEISFFRLEPIKSTHSETAVNHLEKLENQLHEYFEGNRTIFQLKLDLQGTTFQQKVWNALPDVPFGETRTYLEQARILGDEKAIRAVASANGKNPLVIVIPCHRIIGSDGSLTGYAGELWRKRWLLEHEQKFSGKNYQGKLF